MHHAPKERLLRQLHYLLQLPKRQKLKQSPLQLQWKRQVQVTPLGIHRLLRQK
jgi:hypothetical protein